ncbi:MAG: alpha/beta hydrolase [Chloroflexota bacterium]|jgi:pimeloyl-ACP methyl ester carboxylesterase
MTGETPKEHIPFDEFAGDGPGGPKPLLHFAHANAYPPGAYRSLLAALASHYRVLASHHRPLWPGSQPQDVRDWEELADDLIRFFDQQGLRGVIGVGHSLGAVTTMLAALKRPDLFRALVLIEPVFLPQTVLDLLVAGATLDEPYETPLVKIAQNRRNWWPSRRQAFEHFRSKEVFGRWPDESLWDYVRYGTVEDGSGGVRLAYSPEWEARIYALPPTGVWKLIPEITQPTLAMRGRESDTLIQPSWTLWQEVQPQATFQEFAAAGHLLPMELPGEVAARIGTFVERLPNN